MARLSARREMPNRPASPLRTIARADSARSGDLHPWLLVIAIAERLLEAGRKFAGFLVVVLRAVLLDFDGAHQGCDAAGRFPVQSLHQAMQESGSECVPAAGRVFDGDRGCGRDDGDYSPSKGSGTR